jgi:hypothetical protein
MFYGDQTVKDLCGAERAEPPHNSYKHNSRVAECAYLFFTFHLSHDFHSVQPQKKNLPLFFYLMVELIVSNSRGAWDFYKNGN